jgi:CheY-like chemotaxis protein
VLVTALQNRADKIRGIEAGADDFLTKPSRSRTEDRPLHDVEDALVVQDR